MVIVMMSTDTGLTEIMNSPSPKNEVKISPMITSGFNPDRSDSSSIAAAASPPDRNAPKANGSPSM